MRGFVALEGLVWYWGKWLVCELVVLWPLLVKIVGSVGDLLSGRVEVLQFAERSVPWVASLSMLKCRKKSNLKGRKVGHWVFPL
ncbi:hypothetical protein GE21DRAFT_1289836 [Neurospora crassa]|nr:hypothetical protein GE21DRAFT_1289836 [Neurospora crassa]